MERTNLDPMQIGKWAEEAISSEKTTFANLSFGENWKEKGVSDEQVRESSSDALP